MKQLNEKIRTECPLLGKWVVVTRTCRKGLNGKTGVATAFDHGRGCYVVALALASEKQEERKRRSGQAEPAWRADKFR